MDFLLAPFETITSSAVTVVLVSVAGSLWSNTRQRSATTTATADDAAPRTSSFVASTVSLDAFHESSITDAELTKLRANPKFIEWAAKKEQEVATKAAERDAINFGIGLGTFVLILFGVLLLPFESFALEGNEATLQDLIRQLPIFPQRYVASTSLAALVFFFFAASVTKWWKFGVVISFITLVYASSATLTAGAGLLAIALGVATRLFS